MNKFKVIFLLLIGMICLFSSSLLAISFGTLRPIKNKLEKLKTKYEEKKSESESENENIDEERTYVKLVSPIGGDYYSDNILLTQENSPFIMNDDLFVGGVLKIEPGVKIYTTYGYSLSASNIIAKGEKDNQILITSNEDTPSVGDFGGVVFNPVNNACGYDLEYIKIEYAENAIKLINYSGDQYTIENNSIINCTLINNTYGIYNYGRYVNPIIKNNFFNNNSNADIYIHQYSNPEITYNNLNIIWIFQGSKPVINNNNINEINNSTANDIDATNNWWGTTNAGTINNNIYDYNDNNALGTVNYNPIATSTITTAGPE